MEKHDAWRAGTFDEAATASANLGDASRHWLQNVLDAVFNRLLAVLTAHMRLHERIAATSSDNARSLRLVHAVWAVVQSEVRKMLLEFLELPEAVTPVDLKLSNAADVLFDPVGAQAAAASPVGGIASLLSAKVPLFEFASAAMAESVKAGAFKAREHMGAGAVFFPQAPTKETSPFSNTPYNITTLFAPTLAFFEAARGVLGAAAPALRKAQKASLVGSGRLAGAARMGAPKRVATFQTSDGTKAAPLPPAAEQADAGLKAFLEGYVADTFLPMARRNFGDRLDAALSANDSWVPRDPDSFGLAAASRAQEEDSGTSSRTPPPFLGAGATVVGLLRELYLAALELPAYTESLTSIMEDVLVKFLQTTTSRVWQGTDGSYSATYLSMVASGGTRAGGNERREKLRRKRQDGRRAFREQRRTLVGETFKNLFAGVAASPRPQGKGSKKGLFPFSPKGTTVDTDDDSMYGGSDIAEDAADGDGAWSLEMYCTKRSACARHRH